MAILFWVMTGLTAGWMTNRLLRSPHAFVVDVLLGTFGSLAGGVLFGTWIPAALGAILLLALHQWFVVRWYGRAYAFGRQ